jgi:hypothetical protein
MPPSFSFVRNRLAATGVVARNDLARLALVGLPHLAALVLLAWSEAGFIAKAAFLLTWGLFNFAWLALLRRPAVAAALSLAMIALLMLLSQLKYSVLMMTASFVDVLIVDTDAVDFLFTIFPSLRWMVALAALAILPLLILAWRCDRLRVRRSAAAAGALGCLGGIIALGLLLPLEPFEAFYGGNYVSSFARSGVEAAAELATHGMFESEAVAAARLAPADEVCRPARKPPHIILVHDESSFDIRALPGIKVPPGYGGHFQSFDGKARHFIVEGAGGPSWYTEYNVLAGLSARSFGRFAYFVPRIAAGRIERGLPHALRRCGYRTYSLYPALGAFMSARSFHHATGVQRFLDRNDMRAGGIEPDSFYFDAAARAIARNHRNGPMFVFVYLAANHLPWDDRWRPDLLPHWRDPGNKPEVDEYLRRQAMSALDYAEFRARLQREFPEESFLLVRFGDHQPDFATPMIEPQLDEAGIARRLMAYDPRYFTTYYAIDAINFTPADVSAALDPLEGPYLPLIVQEAAGLPLEPSFAEQKNILQRCQGLFYSCAGGMEARNFNRMLIDAGLLKRL